MVADRPRGDDDLTELPWASVFDPAANARALSAIQAEGFRAASRVVDRFAQIAGNASGARQGTDAGAAKAAAPLTPGLNPDVDLIITTWWTVVGQMFRAMRGETVSGDESSVNLDVNANVNANVNAHVNANVDVATGTATGAVQVASGETAEIWLHNSGSDDSADTVLRCSDLLAHDGALISSTAVAFTPAVVPLPARSSRGIAIRVEAGDDVKPGSYRGTILLSDHADVWLPIVVVVPPPTP
jgi:hypothetical protein